jgi:hypothetical protein
MLSEYYGPRSHGPTVDRGAELVYVYFADSVLGPHITLCSGNTGVCWGQGVKLDAEIVVHQRDVGIWFRGITSHSHYSCDLRRSWVRFPSSPFLPP